MCATSESIQNGVWGNSGKAYVGGHQRKSRNAEIGQYAITLSLPNSTLILTRCVFDRERPLGNSDQLSLYFDYVCFSCPNQSVNRKRNLWKGNFEGMRHHLHIQNWDMMLVGYIETKWLGFKTVLLDLIEKFCPLARPKPPLAKPWLSRHIVAMQKQKKRLYKKFCLHVPKSTGLATKTTTGFTPGHCGVPGQFMNRTSLRVQSGTRKSYSGISAKGQKKRPYPRVEEAKWLHRNK